MKVHKIEIRVLNLEDMPESDVVYFLENVKYLCPKVVSIQTVDVPDFHDDHPLNKRDTCNQAYNDLFKEL